MDWSLFTPNRFLAETAPTCAALSRELDRLLIEALDPVDEMHSAINALRELGHELVTWDLNEWGADHVPGASGRALHLTFIQSDDDQPWETHVLFDRVFGRSRDDVPSCPSCGAGMGRAFTVFKVEGHGRVDGQAAQVRLTLGSRTLADGYIGIRGKHIELGHFECKVCEAIFVPPYARPAFHDPTGAFI